MNILVILNPLFRSEESLAKEIELDNKTIINHWKEYMATVPKKTAAFEEIYDLQRWGKDFHKELLEFKGLLNLELKDIGADEKSEKRLITDLESMTHFERIKRVERLKHCLDYAETQHEYLHGLLRHIHLSLMTELHIVDRLIKGAKTYKNLKKLFVNLKLQIAAEEEAIKNIKKMPDFRSLFIELVKGQHTIRQMDAKEKKLLKKMQQILGKAVNDSWSEEMYRKMLKGTWKKDVMKSWVMLVFNATEEKIDECIAEGVIRGHHQHVEFELVNKPAFVDLCRDCYKQLMKRDVNESLLNVFVHVFREWFNDR